MSKKKLEVKKSPRGNDKSLPELPTVRLGTIVEEVITGFAGVAMGRVSFIDGCDRIIIQPRELKDG